MRVFIYFNLLNQKWSIKDLETKIVVGYAKEVVLEDVEFYVSEAGRQRVIREQQKNVHAGVRGNLVSFTGKDRNNECIKRFKVSSIDLPIKDKNNVTYNPYHLETFVYKNSKEPVKVCKKVYMNTLNKQVNIIE